MEKQQTRAEMPYPECAERKDETLPKKIFFRADPSYPNQHIHAAAEKPDYLLERGRIVKIGVYQLVEVWRVSAQVKVEEVSDAVDVQRGATGGNSGRRRPVQPWPLETK